RGHHALLRGGRAPRRPGRGHRPRPGRGRRHGVRGGRRLRSRGDLLRPDRPSGGGAVSAPAPAPARVLAQARFETVGLLRHGEQLIVSLVLPLMALVGLALAPYPALAVGPWAGAARIDVLSPGVVALAVMSTAFTGQAILL